MAQVNHDLFLCFRGADVRYGFLSFLVDALESTLVKYFVDYKEIRGEITSIFLKRIEESRVVLVIFSENFMDSQWCTKEVHKALATRGPGKTIIPIFYKVSLEQVEKNWSVVLEGELNKWSTITNAKYVTNVTEYLGLVYTGKETRESDFVKEVVKEVEKTLTILETKEGSKGEANKQEITSSRTTTALSCFGIEPRMKQLQKKLMMDRPDETRVVGVIGTKGIGKTKLVEKFFDKVKEEFDRPFFFKSEIRKKMENDKKKDLLLMLFLKRILEKTENVTITCETRHEHVKEQLLEIKFLLVLDDLSSKEEISHLLGDRGWLTKGSKIVILTSNKSHVEGLVDDMYIVPGLNEKEGLECFSYHAFGDATHCESKEGNLLTLSRKFVDYAKGNPKALMVLGKEVFKRDEGEWESIFHTIEKSPNKDIRDLLNSSYDGLTEPQQDAFLDITCFFRSQDHKFVARMVDSPFPADERSIIKDLADKFLIEISGDQVEMNGLVCTLGKNLASHDNARRLWDHGDIIKVLTTKLDFPGDVRGIFLDISQVTEKIPLRRQVFVGMNKLRYLKIYDTRICSLVSESKITIRNGLEFTLEELRYLHWLKFPLDELPRGFLSTNLIDLNLPYSHIKRLWNGQKDVGNLTWVDLNHSIELHDLSGLLGAVNLQILNLEGCTKLTILPAKVLHTMNSLVFLNLRSCTRLRSLPEINIKSLKTLILSNCSKFKKFQLILENLEALYLDGTALKELPESIKDMQKLVILNMKDCEKLESVPDSLGQLQALQEVILSGCSNLLSFPNVTKRLRILLLDGTSITLVPRLFPSAINGLSLLRRLCLSGNNVIQTLQTHIGQLYHLQCLDIKHCKNLTSIPTLPPNLQCFDAHGCDSLATVANPLAFLNLTDQIHSTFIFSECNNLDERAKSCIISYIQKKSQLMITALNRYNMGSGMESYTGACFPGCDVPEWFSHKDYGSKMEIKLPNHQNENQIKGVALCAAVSFEDYRGQNNGFLLKCTCDFKNADGLLIRSLHCTIGGFAGPGKKASKIESEHVFVCYKSLLQIKKQSEEEDTKASSSITASFKFESIDDAEKVVEYKVFKCGLSLLYESQGTDHDNVSWEVNLDGSPMVDDIIDDDVSMSSEAPEADEMSMAGQGFDDDEGQQEEEKYSVYTDGSGIFSFDANDDSDPNMDEETIPSTSLPATSSENQIQHKGESRLEVTSGMSPVTASAEIQPGCNSGEMENFKSEAESPSIQEPHGIIQVIKDEEDTTWFSLILSFIPCLNSNHKDKFKKTYSSLWF